MKDDTTLVLKAAIAVRTIEYSMNLLVNQLSNINDEKLVDDLLKTIKEWWIEKRESQNSGN